MAPMKANILDATNSVDDFADEAIDDDAEKAGDADNDDEQLSL